jgi:energy-coupling factor transporter ATP-binding protein EcfA2
MLVSFTVSNFRSFKDEATLDLRAPRGSAAGATPWDGNLQSVAAIYGANASGKTTFFRAIQSMVEQVRDSYRLSAVVGQPFAFDSLSKDRPTEFSATFVARDAVCYAYGFSVLNGHVVEEWAERYSTARPTRLFERAGQTLKFGVGLKGPNRAVENTLRPSSLYLSAAIAAGHTGLKPIYDWFLHQLRPFAAHGHESLLGHVVFTLTTDHERLHRVSGMLSKADLGLDGLRMEVHELTEAERTQAQRAQEALRALTGDNALGDLPAEVCQAFGTHVSGGQSHDLPLDFESDGTKAMLCHAFVIDEALRTGATVVFDEIDASLHPLLVRALVRTFQDKALNPEQAQLIFTTHDVSLLDSGHGDGAQLSRDEFWRTEKDGAGRSSLVAVADFIPRTRENLARRYLSGRYGGIPDAVDLIQPVLV